MKQFKPSATGAIHAKATQMRKSGLHVYNFSAGDPVLLNHPIITEAAFQAIRRGASPYAPIAGLFELRKAAADWMNQRYGSEFDINQTIVTCGGKFGIYAALQTLLEEGDEVLIIAPHWVSYPEMVRLAHGSPILISTEHSLWKLTPKDLQLHITSKSKILLLNNACNPTGVLYSREEIQALLHIAKKAGLIVISDEVYSEIVYEGSFVSCASFAEHRSHVVVIETCSKNFAMPGWRVGFAFGPDEIIANMIALQSQSTTGTCHISQYAALAALTHSSKIASHVRERMRQRRDLFFQTYNRLFNTSVKPVASSLYFFAKIGADSLHVCEKILTDAHVALIPGIAFGVEGYARFAFSEEESEIVKGLEALEKVLQK